MAGCKYPGHLSLSLFLLSSGDRLLNNPVPTWNILQVAAAAFRVMHAANLTSKLVL